MNIHNLLRVISTKLSCRIVVATGVLAFVAAGPRPAQAQQVFANFDGGNDSNAVAGNGVAPGPDTYKGTAGNGWSAGYTTYQAGGLLSATVTNTNPLLGGGNYLAITDNATGSSVDGAVTRPYNGASATAAQTIGFNYRLETTLTKGYATVGDTTAGAAGVSPSSSFIIRDYATNTGTAVANTWAVYNGAANGASLNTNLFVNSGLAVTPGDVYQFTVNLNPASKNYTVTIADLTTNTSYTSGTEGFRQSSTTLTNVLAFNDNDNGVAGLGYSIDSLTVSGTATVPEPSTWMGGLALCGVLGAFVRRQVLPGKAKAVQPLDRHQRCRRSGV